MIKKLRRNFIALAMGTLIMAMGMVLGIVALLAMHQVTGQYEILLDWMLAYDGKLPDGMEEIDEETRQDLAAIPEIIYETRYFSVELDADREITDMHLSFIHSVNADTVRKLTKTALKYKRRHGWIWNQGSQYLFKWKVNEDGGILLVFIDATSRAWILTTVTQYMVLMATIVVVVYFFLYSWYSRRIVQPYIETQEQQKRFITNASHELKTPLAVISANTEMLEAKSGENKWTQSTMRQIERMTGLIQELVTLSRLDEKKKTEFVKVDWSQICAQEAEAFAEVARNAGLEFTQEITKPVYVKGEEKALRELVTIFLDNAVKYCDTDGIISVHFTAEKHMAVFRICNSYANGRNVDYDRFFERFYRADESHNSKKSGYGIGLSIAKQIVEILGGTLKAEWKDNTIQFVITLKTV
ncbi:MAG: HAMP domain-containing histidine kinase [Lachnospiraceae bacterium]|nr:HAMP domain-containing histidine kinase [Lachnospiraceae bacterium]